MKTFKKLPLFLMVLALLALLVLPGCDDKNKDNPEYSADDIVGTWGAQSMTVKLMIESDKDQNGVNPLLAGTGGINVTGAATGTLQYQLVIDLGPLFNGLEKFDGSFYSITSSNLPLINVLDLEDVMMKPALDTLQLNVSVMEGAPFYAALSYYTSTTGDDFENEDGAGLSFNDNTYALSAATAQLWNDWETASATLNGTLTSKAVEMKKDKATTVVDLPVPMTGDEALLTFNEDGTFTGNIFVDGEGETGEGEWTIDGNILTLSVENLELEGLGELDGQLDVEIEMDDGDMIATIQMELMELLEEMTDDEAEFLMFKNIIESVFGMDANSMSEIIVEAEITLSPAAAIAKPAKCAIVGRAMAAPAHGLLQLVNKAKKTAETLR